MQLKATCRLCGTPTNLDQLDSETVCDDCRRPYLESLVPTETPAPPEFTPTPEQASALANMLGFLTDFEWNTPFEVTGQVEPFFILEGYAGTGKTFSITQLVKAKKVGSNEPRFKPSQIIFTAPTNKAVKVLRRYLDEAGLSACPTKTIYSLLGLSLQANGEVKELAKPEEPVDLSSYKVIIVDEASMTNRFLMDAIRDASEDWNVPFIFMGDPAQLPPVGEITSPVWKIPRKSRLTQVMRYGNAMLDLATDIRKVVDNPFPSIKVMTNPPVYRWGRGDWLNKIEENLELFKSGDAKIIAWRNVTVSAHNQYIRKLIFGSEARQSIWLPSDQIVARAPLKNLEGETFMQNAEEARILEVAVGFHPMWKEFEIFNLLVEHESGKKHTIRTLTETGSFHVNNRLNELSMEAKSGKKYKWREFWELKEAFHDVRHSYAWTSHMSQGSSILKGFADLEDIMVNRNKNEAFRSLYVACTRQREELHVA